MKNRKAWYLSAVLLLSLLIPACVPASAAEYPEAETQTFEETQDLLFEDPLEDDPGIEIQEAEPAENPEGNLDTADDYTEAVKPADQAEGDTGLEGGSLIEDEETEDEETAVPVMPEEADIEAETDGSGAESQAQLRVGTAEITGISFTPAQPYVYEEYTHGWTDSSTGKWEYQITPETGDILKIHYSDHTIRRFQYSKESFGFYDLTSPDTRLICNLYFEADPSKPIIVGKNTLRVTCELLQPVVKSFETTVSLTILERPVYSYTPVQPIIYEMEVDGCEKQSDGSWLYYTPYPKTGDTITVHHSTGEDEVYVYSEEIDNFAWTEDSSKWLSGNLMSPPSDPDLQPGEHVLYYLLDAPIDPYTDCLQPLVYVSCPVTIIARPTMTFTPAKPLVYEEGTHGFSYLEGWYYCPPSLTTGDKITLHFETKDVVYVYSEEKSGFFNAAGEELTNVEFVSPDEQFEQPWEAGAHVFTLAYKKTMHCEAITASCPVTIFRPTMTFTPARPLIIEERTCGIPTDGGSWYYSTPDFETGDKITLHFETEDAVYVYSEEKSGFFNTSGERLINIGIYAPDEQLKQPWEVGVHEYTLVYTRNTYCPPLTAPIPITIQARPVITFTPVRPLVYEEETHGFHNPEIPEVFWFYNAPDFETGDRLTVRDNGVTTVYVYSKEKGGFFSAADPKQKLGVYVWYGWPSEQYITPWKPGKHAFNLAYDRGNGQMLITTTVPVTITEKSADYALLRYTLTEVPSDQELTRYTDTSVKNLKDAVAAGKAALNAQPLKRSQQSKVDALTQAIVNAIANLKVKPTPSPGTPTTSPAAPSTSGSAAPKLTLIAAYNGAKGVGVKWVKLSGATEYTIWQKYQGNWRKVKTVKPNDSSLQVSGNTLMYTDTTVKNGYGKGYIYSVSAKVGSTVVDYDRAGVAIYRLNPPALKTAKNSKAGQVVVTWKGVFGRTETNGAYDLQYATEANAKAGKWINARRLPGFAHNVTSATITGLKKGTKYVFRIRCSKTNKDRGTFYSEYSPWMSVQVKK